MAMWPGGRKATRSRLCSPLCVLLVVVLVLIGGYFFYMNRSYPLETYFRARLTEYDQKVLDDTFQVLDKVLREADIPYMMLAGTMLGSYRHHGIIPWDVDGDVILDLKDKERARYVLTHNLPPDYVMVSRITMLPWKVYNDKLGWYCGICTRMFKRPSIDVFFFDGNETHIWEDPVAEMWNIFRPFFRKADPRVYPREDIFPLSHRPYGEMSLPGPCNTEGWLNRQFGGERGRVYECKSPFTLPDTLVIVPDPWTAVPCEDIPFIGVVHHKEVEGGQVLEELRQGEQVVGTFTRPADPCKNPVPREKGYKASLVDTT